MDSDQIPNEASKGEAESSSHNQLYSISLQLTPEIRSRFRQFMNRQEFIGMRQSEIIGILLDREESVETFTNDYQSKRPKIQPPQIQREILDQANQRISGQFSISAYLNINRNSIL